MSITSNYTVVTGDTFVSVARKVYGDDQQSTRIARANPGVMEPLGAGAVLTIPQIPGAPVDRQPATAADSSEVSILIGGRRFRFWDSVRVVRSVDSFDTARVTAPFSVDLPGFRETFRPFSYQGFEVSIGADRLFTGTMISVAPDVTPTGKTIAAGGYSLPGVLNDCTPPASAYPLEFNNQTLREIATTVADTFGLSVEFAEDPGPVFERVAMTPGKKALTFLIELAKQRNLVISNTAAGAIIFHRPGTVEAPVAVLRLGEPPLLSVTPVFAPQEYYSHITGVEPVFFGFGGGSVTEPNTRLRGVMRPLTFKITDVESAEVAASVEAKMSRMFGNAAAYTVKVATWRTPSGAIWAPGDTVSLDAPDAMVYGAYKFIIRRVDLTRTRDGESAQLDLVLPGSFGGEIPEALPWEN